MSTKLNGRGNRRTEMYVLNLIAFALIFGGVWLVGWYVSSNITEPKEWSRRRREHWNKYHHSPWW